MSMVRVPCGVLYHVSHYYNALFRFVWQVAGVRIQRCRTVQWDYGWFLRSWSTSQGDVWDCREGRRFSWRGQLDSWQCGLFRIDNPGFLVLVSQYLLSLISFFFVFIQFSFHPDVRSWFRFWCSSVIFWLRLVHHNVLIVTAQLTAKDWFMF